MPDLNTIFTEVSQIKEVATGADETTRGILGSTLAFEGSKNTPNVFLPSAIATQSVRISGGSDNAITEGTNQSPRGQIEPNTNNKVPRLYGNVTTGGVIVDATQPSANTLLYCMVLSEMDYNRFDRNYDIGNERAFTIHDVYRNNDRCFFRTATNAESTVKILQSLETGSNADIETANVLNVRAWAGNSSANAQIFPVVSAGSRKNAYDIFPTWTSANTMDGLVFAIVEVDRYNTDIDPGANATIDEFGSWRFTIETNGQFDYTQPGSSQEPLNNPAWALLDYLTSDRYGVGLSNSDIDLNSISSWATYCAENVNFAADYLIAGGSSVTFPTPPGGTGYINNHDRHEINGFINTQNSVATNITSICQAGMGTFTYNNRTGLFQVLVNRAMTSSERANAFHFTSDNIISSITVNNSDIFSLYNSAEVRFPNYQIQDQADFVFVNTPASEKLVNEPTSIMNFELSTVSDRTRASQIANITLGQSRVSQVVNFAGDHSTLSVDVGDFVKVSDQAKGWTEKYFRVMRITEDEFQGEIACQFNLIEYTDTPYEKIIYYDTVNESYATGFGTEYNWDNGGTLSFTDRWTNTTPTFGNVYVSDNPASGLANIVDPSTGSVIGNGNITSLFIASGNPVGFEALNESWIAIATPAPTATFDNAYLVLEGQDGLTYSPAYTTTVAKQDAPTLAGSFIHSKINKITSGTYKISVRYENEDYIPFKESITATTANITILDRRTDGNTLLDTYGVGTDIVQTASMSNVSLNAAWYKLHTPIQHDISNIAEGEFTFVSTVTPTWTTIQPTSNIGFSPTGNVTFVNDSNITSYAYEFNSGGFFYSGSSAMNASNINGNAQTITGTIQIDPGFYGLDSDWYASRANVVMRGISSGTGNDINFTAVDYRIYNKSAYYRGEA